MSILVMFKLGFSSSKVRMRLVALTVNLGLCPKSVPTERKVRMKSDKMALIKFFMVRFFRSISIIVPNLQIFYTALSINRFNNSFAAFAIFVPGP